MSEMRKVLVLDPDLYDGCTKVLHEEPDDALLDLIRTWIEHSTDGDSVTITLREMTQQDFDDTPEV